MANWSSSALTALLLLVYPSTVLGQGSVLCTLASIVEQNLSIRHGEKPVATGLTSEGWLVERWESESGTWTLTVRPKKRLMCVLVFGDNWRELLKPDTDSTPIGENRG